MGALQEKGISTPGQPPPVIYKTARESMEDVIDNALQQAYRTFNKPAQLVLIVQERGVLKRACR